MLKSSNRFSQDLTQNQQDVTTDIPKSNHRNDIMKPSLCTYPLLLIAMSLPTPQVFAQPEQSQTIEFNLFEAVEQPQGAGDESARPVQLSRQATAGEPVFTLVGISRIGDRRTLMLRHRDGEEVVMSLNGDSLGSIPGYGEYQIVDSDSQQVSLRYPATVPCQEFSDRGVGCDNDAVGRLRLTNAAPLVLAQQNESAAAADPSQQSDAGSAQAADGETRNPFELIRERARAGQAAVGDTSANRRRFQPRRIADEDIPPGMRRVSTPFGDRLVPE